MLTLFTVCAVLGSAVLLFQLALTLFGFDFGHGDGHFDFGHGHGDAHHDGNAFFSVLSFRSLVAFVAFFGLAGRVGLSAQWAPVAAFLVAGVCGIIAMVLVAWVMQILHRLKQDSTVRLEDCIGKPARVYLSIPAHNAGKGKVTVNVADRTIELPAITDSGEIPTGAEVVVVGVGKDETLEVVLESNLDSLALE